MRQIKNFTTRDIFLAKIFNDGLGEFSELHELVENPNDPITNFDKIVDIVIAAEDKGILYKKSTKSSERSSYHKNVRWYMGQLERTGKIKGFTGVVGRPKGSRNSESSILESCQGLLDS